MDSDSIGTILVLAVLLVCSAFFSATETAFSSLNRVRIKNMAEGGDKRAALVQKLYENYDKLLTTILVGNNIVNIASASIATLFFVRYWGDWGTTLSTIVMTILVLIFGEISPKSLAKEAPERFALFSAPLIHLLMTVLTPVNYLFSQWKRLLALVFKISGDRSITEAELLTIVEEAEQEGAIDEEDSELIHSVIRFNDRKVSSILTPRVDVVGLDVGATRSDIAAVFADTEFSRLPVYEDSMDQVVGVIHQTDFYNLPEDVQNVMEAIMKPVSFAVPSQPISELLKQLQREKCHIAVVSDEYGGTVGIVTMEDILEELVGEIWDEHDEVVEELQQLEPNRYRVNCSADLEKVLDFFQLTNQHHCASVSGWIMAHIGKIPAEGDRFEIDGLRITVERTEKRRVITCLVERLEMPAPLQESPAEETGLAAFLGGIFS